MKYQVTRLDKRHAHHIQFEYMIEFSKSWRSGTGALDFDRARRWFNQTYGYSQEANLQSFSAIATQNSGQPSEINTHWAYHTEYKNFRIYTNSSEVAWFQLKFTNES